MTLSADAVRTRLLSVVDYHRLVDAGILDEGAHVELLEGILVEVSPQGERHAQVIQRLTARLVKAAGDRLVVRPQLPLTFEDSEPEPDLAVVRAEDAASREAHPSRALLVAETASASLEHDRSVKARIYARASVPEYWIVNLQDACVEAYRDADPATARYRSVSTYGRAETLASTAIPGLTVEVGTLVD